MGKFQFTDKPSIAREEQMKEDMIKTGSATTTESYEYEPSGADIIRRFKPNPTYVDPNTAGQGGFETLMFGAPGPAAAIHQANTTNAQLHANYQQMEQPHITPSQQKLRNRILSQDNKQIMPNSKSMLKDDDMDPDTVTTVAIDNKPVFMAGINKYGEPIHNFATFDIVVPKQEWLKNGHLDFIKGKYGNDKYLDVWKGFKDYMKDNLSFTEQGNGIRISARPSKRLNLSGEAVDILNALFSKPSAQSIYDANEAPNANSNPSTQKQPIVNKQGEKLDSRIIQAMAQRPDSSKVQIP